VIKDAYAMPFFHYLCPVDGVFMCGFYSLSTDNILEQDSLDSPFSIAIDISNVEGEEASSSLALGTVSAEVRSRLEDLLNLLQQDTTQLVDDSDPAKVIFKTVRGHIPADVQEARFQASHLESCQLQYQKATQCIADRAAQAQLKEEMLQVKHICWYPLSYDYKHHFNK